MHHNLNKKTAKISFSRFWFEKVLLTSKISNNLHEELKEIASLFVQKNL